MIAVPAPFVRRDGDVAIDLAGGEVRFTTVASGDLRLSRPDVTEPLPPARALAARIGIPWDRWAQDLQLHGAHVRVSASEGELRSFGRDADGQATPLPDVACLVRVADCLPIALVAPEAVAMLHGGWRPLAGDVVAHGVEALRGLGATEIQAAIGPGAGPCCFEAGEEVHAAFAPLGRPGAPVRTGNNADLKAVARAQLAAAGVAVVHDVGVCTICADPADLYSYRRDAGETGRQAGLVWRS